MSGTSQFKSPKTSFGVGVLSRSYGSSRYGWSMAQDPGHQGNGSSCSLDISKVHLWGWFSSSSHTLGLMGIGHLIVFGTLVPGHVFGIHFTGIHFRIHAAGHHKGMWPCHYWQRHVLISHLRSQLYVGGSHPLRCMCMACSLFARWRTHSILWASLLTYTMRDP